MTRYQDDPAVEQDELFDDPELDTAPPEDDAPEETLDDAPETSPVDEPAAPAQPASNEPEWLRNLSATMQKTAELQQQELVQRQQAEAQRQAELNRPKGFWEEHGDEYTELQASLAYADESQKRRYRELDALRVQEVTNQALSQFEQQRLAPLRLEMNADRIVQSAAQQAVQQASGYITAEDFQAAAGELFGTDRAQLAAALDPNMNPNATRFRDALADLAAGRALRTGRIAPKANPTPPGNPRSAARPADGKSPVNEITDKRNVQEVLDNLFG